ncbi:MAG: DUF2089 domain-containing protein [Anaerolineaceae bacterium]|nr:DUF2089 domain-containing protein [Anaerolineaceae bacterium]MBN2676644.1 DUF2089 domain-containing protein [Anaerolineaceae bacterium]
MRQMLANCPVCDKPLEVTRLYCSACDTIIEGHFRGDASPFHRLTPEQNQFALTFIRCEGRINRMEDELKLSYPTIRNRLVEVIRALGFEPAKEDQGIKLTPEERTRILDKLAKGKLTSEQANRLLLGEDLPVEAIAK